MRNTKAFVGQFIVASASTFRNFESNINGGLFKSHISHFWQGNLISYLSIFNLHMANQIYCEDIIEQSSDKI